MEIVHTSFPGLYLIRPKIIEDARGFFMEVYRKDALEEIGFMGEFVQVNHTYSRSVVLRGLHFQWDPPLGKFIRVLGGAAFMVIVDIRKNLPTVGKWIGFEVSAANKIQIWAPSGFATGFCVAEAFAEVEYHYTAFHNPEDESIEFRKSKLTTLMKQP